MVPSVSPKVRNLGRACVDIPKASVAEGWICVQGTSNPVYPCGQCQRNGETGGVFILFFSVY